MKHSNESDAAASSRWESEGGASLGPQRWSCPARVAAAGVFELLATRIRLAATHLLLSCKHRLQTDPSRFAHDCREWFGLPKL
jgi:hypothetical protein